MEAFQAEGGREASSGTQGFDPLQTIYMHKNLYNTTGKDSPTKHITAYLKCRM